MIEDILCDDHIQLLIDSKDWRSAIRITAKPLLEKQYINASYVEAMIDSVVTYGPYIVITENLALAHARPEDGVNQLAISITTLKNEILLGDKDPQKVKIIFCLAAIDASAHLEIMKSLVNIINCPGKVDKIASCHDITQLKKLLITKEELS